VKFLKDALNRVLSDSNIDVSMTTGNRLSFTTSDGRNLSVGVVNDSSADLSDPNELGLDGITVITTTGVEATDQGLLDGIPTAYGRVELAAQSPHFNDPELFGSSPVLDPISGGPGHPPHDRFTIETGASGVTGNFEGLGFTPGTFGGEVTDADSKMQPPKTGRLFFQVGSSANQTITIDLADFGKNGPITSRITSDVDDKVKTIRINTPEGANSVLDALDEAMDKVNATRATMGAVMNRLTYVTDTLTSVSINSSASRSQIEDADYASASTELAKTQIMQQAATAVLAQANMSQQTVLKLLQG
jgi:flagellin